MKKNAFYTCIASSLLFFTQCTSINVVDVNKNKVSERDGMFYTLPRTVVVVEIEKRQVTVTPGKYHKYAKELLGIDYAISKRETTSSLGRVSCSTAFEPDPLCVYKVELNGSNPAVRQSLMLSLSESGLLNSINSDTESNAAVIASGAAETFVSVAGRFLPLPTLGHDNAVASAGGDAFRYLDVRSSADYARADSLNQARALVKKIQDLRARKTELLTGEVPSESKEVIEYMVKEIDKLEAEYITLFTGTRSTSSTTQRFFFTPEGKSIDENVLDNINVKIQKLTNTHAEVISRHKSAKGAKNGFFYRVPGYAKVMVSIDGKPTTTEQVIVAQYGSVQALPAKSGFMRSGYQISFYEETGAIRRVSTNAEGVNAQQFDRVNSAVRNIVNERDELYQLDRERRILEQRKAVQRLREETKEE